MNTTTVQMEAERQIDALFPINQGIGVNMKYYLHEPPNISQINQWTLSQSPQGWAIRTNPDSKAEIHYDGNGNIYRMQIAGVNDTSLDNIVSVSEAYGIQFPHRLDGLYTLKVSGCTPHFPVVRGSTTVYHVYDSLYITQLFRDADLFREVRFTYHPDLL